MYGLRTYETAEVSRPSGGRDTGLGFSGKCAVGPMVVVEVLVALEDRVELVDAGGEVVGFVELVAPSAVAAFDGTVHLRRAGRQDVEGDPLAWQASSNSAMNSLPPSTWMAFTGKGMSAVSLSRKLAAA